MIVVKKIEINIPSQKLKRFPLFCYKKLCAIKVAVAAGTTSKCRNISKLLIQSKKDLVPKGKKGTEK